jgi:hypothetical protein
LNLTSNVAPSLRVKKFCNQRQIGKNSMDCTNVSFALAVLLLVLPTGGIARNTYFPFFPFYIALRTVLMIAWSGGVDASLSMDGGFKGSSYRRKEGSIAKLHVRL